MPKLDYLRRFRKKDYNLDLTAFLAPTPTDGDSSTHEPTKTSKELATTLALTVTGNAAIIVQDAGDSTNGVAIFPQTRHLKRTSGRAATVQRT